MRVVQFMGGERVEVCGAPVPEIAQDEALIRVAVSAICGSELPAYRNGMGESALPNPGHEVAGVVERAGLLSGVAVGQRVGVQVMSSCGKCRHCAHGDFEHCRTGPRVLSGVHADYISAHGSCLVPLPDDIDWETAVLLCGDTLGTPFRALTRLGGARGGQVAAVFGCGPIGLGCLMWLKYFGAQVIVSEPSEYRRNLALTLGADQALDPSSGDVLGRIRDGSGGGVDISLDCSHSPETMTQALEAAGILGRVAFIGEKAEATIRPSDQCIRKELTIVASWYFTVADFHDQLRCYRRGLDPTGLVTHRFGLADAEEAYRLFASRQTGKVVFAH